MKLVRIFGTGAALLLFVTASPAGAQHERQGGGQDRPRQQEKPQGRSDGQSDKDKQRAKPREAQRGETAKPQRGESPSGARKASPSSHERGQAPSRGAQPRREGEPREHVPERAIPRPYSHQPRTEQQARAWQQQRGWLRPGAWQGHSTWREHRAQRWEVEHRTWLQRGGYGGYYIPEPHFRLYFGSTHFFRIRQRPIIVVGYPRFRYHDYWFMLVDPWPESWASDWYLTDDVYIDYDDGYYLYNRRHPGIAVAVSVVF